METETLNGWRVTREPGQVILDKDGQTVATTYAHDDAALAFDHAAAQAWALDCPEQAASLPSEQKWAAIIAWAGGRAGLRLNAPQQGAE